MQKNDLKSLDQLRELLSELTSNNLEEILPPSHLAEDLGIILEDDLPKIIAKVNSVFNINLKARYVLSDLEEVGETVEELAQIIDDEVELG